MVSEDKFGSFILHAAVDFKNFRENALFMLSSSESSVSECVSSYGSSWYSESFGYSEPFGLWSAGLNGSICACDDFCRHCCPLKQFYREFYREVAAAADHQQQQQPQQQQQLVLKLDNIGFPSCYNLGKTPIVTVVGSCNGFICLHDEQPNQFSLWNPATRQFRILPKPKRAKTSAGYGYDDHHIHRLFAFGFDTKTKDYNVVLLSFFNRRGMLKYVIDVIDEPMECVCHVQVYSLSTNSWRPLKNITTLPASPYSHPPNSSPGLFYLNGTCFFTAKLLYSSEQTLELHNNRFLISLDLTKEIITPIQLPSHHPIQWLYLCYFGEKIACFTHLHHGSKVYDANDPDRSWDRFYIHVFNEQRSEWIYFVDFRIILGLSGESYVPIGISNDGVFVLLETEICCGGLGIKKKKSKMKLYNLTTRELERNFLSCDQVLSKAYAYKPSLVSIEAAAKAAAAAGDMVIETAGAAEMDWIGNAAAA